MDDIRSKLQNTTATRGQDNLFASLGHRKDQEVKDAFQKKLNILKRNFVV